MVVVYHSLMEIKYGKEFYWADYAVVMTNNSFIDGVIHRQMRKSLFDSFDKIYILNLHGSTKRREVALDGSKDENVFDIQQGVSINLFCRTEYQKQKECQVYHYDLYGSREDKYSYLNDHTLSDINWEVLNPQSPQFFFVPKNFSVQEEYEKGLYVN